MLALALMVASGFAGLGYQIVWTQQASLWLGHESAAVLAVVTAFFGGLAAGALLLGPRIARSAFPARWYAGCEAVIALWSVALALLMAPISSWLLALTGLEPAPAWQWLVAFGGTFAVLLPATVAMGATLPAMERVVAALRPDGQRIAALYACNTAGAMLGVLATAFWLLPTFGLARTAALCAVLNLACAAAVLRLARPAAMPPRAPEPGQPGARRTLALLAATGLLGIGYEVLVVRVLSQVTEDTVYTFALLLAVYLAGTALGAASYQRAVRGGQLADEERVRNGLLCALGAACLLGTGALYAAEDLRRGVQALLATAGHDGMAAALMAEAVLALVAFALPSALMGALFSHLGTQAQRQGVSLGRALGINTLGATAAPLVFGVLLVPAVGAKFALLTVAVGYLALLSPRAWARPAVVGTLAVAGATAVWAPVLAFVQVPEGGRIVSYREGSAAAVSVVEDGDGVRRLHINNHQQEGSSATRLADARQALLPLLLHPQPQRALFLGLGTGITASAAAADPTLQVEVAELLPEVIEASALFGEAPLRRPRMVAADARRFVKAAGPRYDLIVSDNFHPARSGSGALYTVEHFRAVHARLQPGGLFCQWLPLHQLDLLTLRSIVQAFMAAYPQGTAVLATFSLQTPVLGLVAREDGARFDLSAVRARLASAAPALALAEHGLADDFAVLGNFVAGPRALRRFAGDAPLNTDDRPVVAYRAPRVTYAPDSLPRDRLLMLLGELDADPAEWLDASSDAAWLPRVAAFWSARDRFLDAGRAVRPTADVVEMLRQVREPLLAVLRTSPDFRPAYDPLLRMAGALGRQDAPAARELLGTLTALQPARPEAALALRALGGAAP